MSHDNYEKIAYIRFPEHPENFPDEYRTIPTGTLESLYNFAALGRPTGGFLKKVLSNDLMGAAGHADMENGRALRMIARFIYNRMPNACWGSREKVDQWVDPPEKDRDRIIGARRCAIVYTLPDIPADWIELREE